MGLYSKMYQLYDSFEHNIDVEFPFDTMMLVNSSLRILKGAEDYTLSYSSVVNVKRMNVEEINQKIKEIKLEHIGEVLDDLVNDYISTANKENKSSKKETKENSNKLKSQDNDNNKSTISEEDLVEEDLQTWNQKTTRVYKEYIKKIKEIKNKLDIGDDKLVEYASKYDERIQARGDIIPKNIIGVVEYIMSNYIDERTG